MKIYELPQIRISRFSREVVTDASAKTAWAQAMADAGDISGTKGTVSIKLQKAN